MTVRVNAVLNRTVVVDSDVTTSSPYLQTTSDSSVYLRGDLKRLVYVLPKTVLFFIIQTSDRTQYFKIFQNKLHSVNIQDDQLWAFRETVQKISKITYTVCCPVPGRYQYSDT